jgi:hypothetical protein
MQDKELDEGAERAARFSNPTKILAFDKHLKLAAIYNSYSAASRMMHRSHQLLQKCCSGKIIASDEFYYRELPGEFIVDVDDLNRLTLIEFDTEMGRDWNIYATQSMNRSEIIPESKYKQRFNILQTKYSKRWKDKIKKD